MTHLNHFYYFFAGDVIHTCRPFVRFSADILVLFKGRNTC
uniref:Uncharacterized protein n=1 Tax=Anguilla anguilla TaxID=7936 RepID=A0A0E9UUW4_ANGAN